MPAEVVPREVGSEKVGPGKPEKIVSGDARAYRRLQPSADLAPFVESYWIQEAPAVRDGEAEPTTVLPVGRPELLVHFGDPFEHLERGGAVRMPRSYVMGQRTRPLRVRATGATGIVIVSLHPWSGPAVLGASLASLVDASAEAPTCLGDRVVEELETRVHTAPTRPDRIAVVEDVLRRVVADRGLDPLVVRAVRRINAAWGRVRIGALAGELGLSRRQLGRRFAEQVGLAPKPFARIVRAQKALGLLRAGVPSLEVAMTCGYVDQAHLIHELHATAGRTPCTLTSNDRATPLMRAFNAAHLSHFYNTVYL